MHLGRTYSDLRMRMPALAAVLKRDHRIIDGERLRRLDPGCVRPSLQGPAACRRRRIPAPIRGACGARRHPENRAKPSDQPAPPTRAARRAAAQAVPLFFLGPRLGGHFHVARAWNPRAAASEQPLGFGLVNAAAVIGFLIHAGNHAMGHINCHGATWRELAVFAALLPHDSGRQDDDCGGAGAAMPAAGRLGHARRAGRNAMAPRSNGPAASRAPPKYAAKSPLPMAPAASIRINPAVLKWVMDNEGWEADELASSADGKFGNLKSGI